MQSVARFRAGRGEEMQSAALQEAPPWAPRLCHPPLFREFERSFILKLMHWAFFWPHVLACQSLCISPTCMKS